MSVKCMGCGAIIQTASPNQKGYIDPKVLETKQEQFYCKRCFDLRHYNKNQKIKIKDQDYLDWMKEIQHHPGLIVWIADLLDLDGTIPSNLSNLFKKLPILMVINKIDLFPKTLLESKKTKSHQKIESSIRSYLKTKKIQVMDLLFMSGKSMDDIDFLLEKIKEYLDDYNHSDYKHWDYIYFVGMTNVGKSTILNQIIKKYTQEEDFITVSNTVNTTLDFIYIPWHDQFYFVDTPGLINPNSYLNYLDKKTLDKIIPKSYLRPKVYQLEPHQALFIQGFLQINFIEGEKSSFVTYCSNTLYIHRTKEENAHEFYQNHLDDILKYPTKQERAILGNRTLHQFSFSKEEKIDISIPGIGFISIYGSGTLQIYCFESIQITKRKAIF